MIKNQPSHLGHKTAKIQQISLGYVTHHLKFYINVVNRNRTRMRIVFVIIALPPVPHLLWKTTHSSDEKVNFLYVM